MSDRHIAYTVVLETELKDEDSERVIAAIEMVRGVMSVVPVVAEPEFYVARQQASFALQKELWKALKKTGE